MSTKCPDCGKHISKCMCQPTLSSDVLEAVPEWGAALIEQHTAQAKLLMHLQELVATLNLTVDYLEQRVAALEPKYEQCPDCKQLLERVAALERLLAVAMQNDHSEEPYKHWPDEEERYLVEKGLGP